MRVRESRVHATKQPASGHGIVALRLSWWPGVVEPYEAGADGAEPQG